MKIVIIVACSTVALIVLLLFAIAILSDKLAFGSRSEKNPLLKYFTAEDFDLSAQPVTLDNGLKGLMYNKSDVPQKDKLIIFCHGMGPGHIAYTTEIAYFCNSGFRVLAVDSRGCNLSEGKNLKGMYSGVQTVISAIDFAKNEGYSDINLVGHSWGAYSALCASAKRKVNKVVAISAPISPVATLAEGAVQMGALPRPLVALLRPFWWLVNFFKYGAKGNSCASRCAKRNGTPTLLIHGDKDKVVTLKKSAFHKAKGQNITKLLAEGKRHNPYNTENAEIQLAVLAEKIKENKFADIMQFDFKCATEEDEEVMRKIVNFIEG